MGGTQHLEWPNVEGQIFQNFELLNIKITKVQFSISFLIFFFKFCRLFKLFEHSKYTYDNLTDQKFSEFW